MASESAKLIVLMKFRDCKSTGDTCRFLQDVTDSGGLLKTNDEPVSTSFDTEIGEAFFEIAEPVSFLVKFRKTEAYKHWVNKGK